MARDTTAAQSLELWADEGPESERLRERLRGLDIQFRESFIVGENVPALLYAGNMYSSRDGINLVINSLLRSRHNPGERSGERAR